MWTLYVEIIAITIIIVLTFSLLFVYVLNNTYSIRICSYTNISYFNISNGRILVTSEPEGITVITYDICIQYSNQYSMYIINYSKYIGITPFVILRPSKNCIIVLISTGDLKYITGTYSGTVSGTPTTLYLTISPCGVNSTLSVLSTSINCEPWIKLKVEYDKVKNSIVGVEVYDISVKVNKYCTGIPIYYEWLGGLVKYIRK